MQNAISVESHPRIQKQLEPVISVIIPAYNEAACIADCLTSVFNQDFDMPYEVIVIDGPSTDNTSAIAGMFPVTLIKLEKRGIGLAWKTGCEFSQADLLVFTEADTVVPYEWLSTIFSLMKSKPQSIGLVGAFVFKRMSYLANAFTRTAIYITDKLHKIWKGTIPFRGKNFAIRRQFLTACGGFDEDVEAYGDVELSLRAQKFGEIVYAPSLLVQTSSRDINGFRNLIRYLRRFVIAVYSLLVLDQPDKLRISDL